MNWKLIFTLSLFGLAMAFATVYIIPSNIEPLIWLTIFIFCAYVIASKCSSKFFLHGFLVSLINSVWITAVHIILSRSYIHNHPGEAEMMTKMPFADHPGVMMLITGPIIGIISGVILGLFAYLAALLLKKKKASNS